MMNNKSVIKRVAFILCIVLMVGCFSGATVPQADVVSKIVLTADNVVDENIYKYHDKHLIKEMFYLLDDQDKFSDDIDGELPDKSAINDDAWKPNFSPEQAYCGGYIDLKQNHIIEKIVLFDVNGNQELTIKQGSPFNWQEVVKIKLNMYRGFQVLDMGGISTRYLHLYVPSVDSGFSEIVLYGKIDRSVPPQPKTEQKPRDKAEITADQAFGVNAFVDDPLHVSKVGGHIREFHNISFTHAGKNYFNPSANGSWNFDQYYKSLYDKGIDAVPCIQGTNTYISGDNIIDFSGNEKPIPEGADPSKPESYLEHSSVMFNYAARYGSQTIDPSRLSLADNQEPITGLGYIKYYENFNEQNKDWEGEKSYLSPYEFAAMCSAGYDGHEGRLGENHGIKQADSSAKLVMGGLVGRNVLEYVKLMKAWFESNRTDKLFAVDVVNLHYYARTAIVENTTMLADLKAITDYVAINLPGVEVWVTEFGPEIPRSEIEDRKSQQYLEAKAFATVRMFMTGLAAGVDRMTMFMLRDTDWGQYEDDGLTTQKGSWQTKPSWHYVYGARTALSGTRFNRVVSESDSGYVYEFIGGGKTVYALWLPTMDSTKRQNYSLDVNNKKSAYKTELKDFYAEGITSQVPINKGTVEVELSATPVFISVYDVANVKINKPKELINIESITGSANTLKKIEVMFDEQQIAPITPTARLGGVFENYNNNDGYIASNPNLPENRLYPITAILDLGRNYCVTDIGFYDSFSAGDIIVYAMNSKLEWQEICISDLGIYDMWYVLESEARVYSRYIKIEKYNDASCFEMALYGYPEFE